jgi:hypothetical protein
MPEPTHPPARPSLVPPAAPGVMRPQPRWQEVEYDHTGFYESAHAEGQYASLLVHLNQAGSALVGWAVPPPTPIPMRRVQCFSPTSKALSWDLWVRRERAVVFVADLHDRGDGLISLHAAAVPLAKTYRLTDLWYLADDPTAVLAMMRDGNAIGGLLRLPIPSGASSVRELAIQFSTFDAPGMEPLTHRTAEPRIPGYYGRLSLGKSMTAQPFHGWVSKHSRPLPGTYLDDEASKLAQPAAMRDDLTTGDLGKAIQTWRASPKTTEAEHRATVLRMILNWVKTKTPEPQVVYRGASIAALIRALSSYSVKVRDSTDQVRSRTYREWATLAYADEHRDWEANNRPANQGLVPDIEELGINLGDFLYTFTFATGAAIPLPKFITGKIPEPGKYLRLNLPFFTLGANPFYANVKLEKVKVVLDDAGKPKVDPDEGTIQTSENPFVVFDTANDHASGLVGGYLDVGTGWPTPGIDVKTLQILTTNGTLTKESFDGATFEIGQAESFKASNPLVHGHGPSSIYFSVSGESRGVPFSLRTVADVHASAAWMKVESTWDVFKPLMKPAKILKPSLNLFSGGLAEGFFMSGATGTAYNTPPETPSRPVAPSEVPVTMTLPDFFDVDSHNIPQNAGYLADFSRRTVIEATLAEYRAILQSARATRSSTGWASPEGTEEHNMRLSADRAQALAQAYLDAFYPGLVEPVPPAAINGLGEKPSLEPPLTSNLPQLQDPEKELGLTSRDPAFSAAYLKWTRDHQDQVTCWPLWRRAELRVDGVVILTVGGPQQP